MKGHYILKEDQNEPLFKTQEDQENLLTGGSADPLEITMQQNEGVQTVKEQPASLDMERSIPAMHASITDAKRRLDANSKIFGDSDNMKLVKAKTAEILRILGEKLIAPASDEEFDESFSEVNRGYNELITACRIYVDGAGSPIFPKGRRRLAIVRDILSQAETEQKIFSATAITLRHNTKNTARGLVTFSDAIGSIKIPTRMYGGDEFSEVNEESVAKVRASRFAEIIGAGYAVEKAQILTCKDGDDKLKEFVAIKENRVEADPGNKTANTKKVIDALITGKSVNEMSEFFSAIKDGEESLDRDVLNNILTSDAKDLILCFGSTYNKYFARTFVKALSDFKDALVRSGLDKKLELYVRKSDSDITISYLTTEEKQKFFGDMGREVTEGKDGLLKEGMDTETEYIIDHTKEEPNVDAGHRREGAHYISKKDAPLFEHEPNVNDVIQGQVGNCYFVSCVASLAAKGAKAIKEMMRDNGDGTVTVRFFQYNAANKGNPFSPVYVRINKTIVVDQSGDEIYAKKHLWVQLLEKAYVCSGLENDIFDIYEKTENHGLKAEHDFDSPVFKQLIKKLSAFPSEKQLKENKKLVKGAGTYSHVSRGGFPMDVMPLLTGKSLKDSGIEDADLYWSDTQYAKKDDKKKDLSKRTSFKNYSKLDNTGKEYLINLMREHDVKKAKEIEDENAKISEYNKELKALDKEARGDRKFKKKKKPYEPRGKKTDYAEDDEFMAAKYYSYTGKQLTDEQLGDKDTRRSINTCIGFVKDFMVFMDEKIKLSEKDKKPADVFVKYLKEFSADYATKGKDGEENKSRADFLDSEDFVSVITWLKKSLKNPEDDHHARYTIYSGNYYGKALSIYEDIKKASDEKRVMTSAFGMKIEAMGSSGLGFSNEHNVGGIYSAHAYTLQGVAERTFGGKTYKFVVLRNPWGDGGTEYYYNSKTKSLARREAKNKKDTNGFTLMELSEFMAMSQNVFIEK